MLRTEEALEALCAETIRAQAHNIATGRYFVASPLEETYEPVPFHQPLTVQEVRHFFDTGLMPTDKPQDAEEEQEPDRGESTWVEGTDEGDYAARIRISGTTRLYDPDRCTTLVVGMQVAFLKYETGPDALMKLATRAVGYDWKDMNIFNPDIDPEDFEFVIYEQVFRERWWKPLRDSLERAKHWPKEDEKRLRDEGDGSVVVSPRRQKLAS